ncbi:MAG: hypothetical protein CMG60_03515 [Candidatus Marinimicrobia bacterium]|nr:hypothetical protein [Candidatus Neomarinimicrobiota bacterium]|tara:strand:+ start:4561 stop:4995 length:435 start_codon:yes stop_codon:yes gene_type:complete
MKKIIVLFTLSFLSAQVGEGTLSPVVTYWRTLAHEEKEVFLFSYLTQVYETHSELKNSVGYGEITEWYYENRAEMIYGIFDQLELVKVSEMVRWVDEFYSHGEYANRPFIEALEFAYRFAEASGANMWEKYENLKFDKIKPGKD